MARRKTIPVVTLREKVNRILLVPHDKVPAGQKQIICSLLEEVLMETGNYRGFGWTMVDKERAKETEPGDPDYYDRRYF